MSIEVEGDADEGGGVYMCTVVVWGRPVVGYACAHAAHHAARRLAEARDVGPRRGMQILTDEFGMCEDYARKLLELLTQTSTQLN